MFDQLEMPQARVIESREYLKRFFEQAGTALGHARHRQTAERRDSDQLPVGAHAQGPAPIEQSSDGITRTPDVLLNRQRDVASGLERPDFAKCTSKVLRPPDEPNVLAGLAAVALQDERKSQFTTAKPRFAGVPAKYCSRSGNLRLVGNLQHRELAQRAV